MQKTLFIILLVLGFFFSFQVEAQDNVRNNTMNKSQRITNEELQNKIDFLEKKMTLQDDIIKIFTDTYNKDSFEKLKEMVSNIKVGSYIASGFLVILGFLGWTTIRSWVKTLVGDIAKKKLDEELNSQIGKYNNEFNSKLGKYDSEFSERLSSFQDNVDTHVKKFEDRTLNRLSELEKSQSDLAKDLRKDFDNRVNELSNQFENDYLHLCQVIALRYSSKYDEALDLINWNGNIKKAKSFNQVLRRIIIECLSHAKIDIGKRKKDAWQCVVDLVDDFPNVTNFKLLLLQSLYLKKWDEAFEKYCYYKDIIDIDGHSECERLLFVIYRKLGKFKNALTIAKKYVDTKDIKSKNNFTALYRDLGNFQAAHMTLCGQINDFISKGEDMLPDGWHRLFNTYISNCVDNDKCNEGIVAVEYILGNRSNDPVAVYTSLRLVLRLKNSNPIKSKLLEQIRSAIKELPPYNDATIKAKALDDEHNGDVDRAILFLNNHIERIAADDTYNKFDLYYMKCALSELLIRNNKYKKAVDLLLGIKDQHFGSEHLFLLSKAYVGTGEEGNAKDYIIKASMKARKWAVRASNDIEMKSCQLVMNALADAKFTNYDDYLNEYNID